MVPKGLERVGNQKMNWDYTNYSIVGQNSEKRFGNLWRFAVTQTPVKDHQLMLVCEKKNKKKIKKLLGVSLLVFASGLGDWSQIPGQIIPKTQRKKKKGTWCCSAL